MNGFLVVDEKDFAQLDSKQREWIFYNTLRCLTVELREVQRVNKKWSLIGGAIGGAAVMICFIGGPALFARLLG